MDTTVLAEFVKSRIQELEKRVAEVRTQWEDVDKELRDTTALLQHYRAIAEAEKILPTQPSSSSLDLAEVRRIARLHRTRHKQGVTIGKLIEQILADGHDTSLRDLANTVKSREPELAASLKNVDGAVRAAMNRGRKAGLFERTAQGTYRRRQPTALA